MNPPATESVAPEINRLHAEVLRQTDESKKNLHAALVAAWRAGQLLRAEKKRVQHAMGRGAWLLWLQENFRGSLRTAQNYMRLAESEPDVATLAGLSLRQVYLRLGIATEPKSRAASVPLPSLPPHVRLAHRLLVALKPCADLRRVSPEQSAAYRRDLRALYERLRALFERTPANLRGSS